MKKFLTYFCCLGIIAAANASEQVQNLIENPGFESVGKNIWQIKGWRPVHYRENVQLITEENPASGRYCVELEKKLADTEGFWNSEAIKVKPGEKYLIKCRLRTEGVLKGEKSWHRAGVTYNGYDKSGKRVFWGDVTLTSGTQNWKTYEKNITIPDKVDSLSITLKMTGCTGRAYYDDIEVIRIDEENIKAGIKKESSEFKANGNLSEWPRENVYKLNQSSQVDSYGAPWRGTDDLSAEVMLMYDKEYLYIACSVIDDRHCQPYDNGTIWRGDCIQISMDLMSDNTNPERKKINYDWNDLEFGMALTPNNTPLLWIWKDLECANHEEQKEYPVVDKKNIDYSVARNGNNTVYELRIPWTELWPFNPMLQNKFRFNLLVNDDDGVGRKSTIAISKGICRSKEPALFKSLLLEQARQEQNPSFHAKPLKKTYTIPEEVKIELFHKSPEQKKWEISYKISSDKVGIWAEGKKEIVTNPKTGKTFFSYKPSIVNGPGRYKAGFTIKSPDGKEKYDEEVSFILQDGKSAKTISKEKLEQTKKEALSLLDEIRKKFMPEIERQKTALKNRNIKDAYLDMYYALLRDFCGFMPKDIRCNNTIKARDDLYFLKEIAEKYMERSAEIMEQPSRAKPLPPFNASEKLYTKDGYFYMKERPVALIGPGNFPNILHDLKRLPEYGCNLVGFGIWGGPARCVPEENISNNEKTVGAYFKSCLDRALDANLKVALLVQLHPLPVWIYEKHPDIMDAEGHFLRYSIDHPASREILERYYKSYMPSAGNHPVLSSYILANEPSYNGKDKYAKEKYSRWLKQKYKDIEKLNEAWGSSCKDFSEADPEIYCNDAANYDWVTFNYHRNCNFFKWIRKQLRKHDAETPTHIKIMPLAFQGADVGQGMKHEDLGKINEISGCDGGTHYMNFKGEDEYIFDFFEAQTMLYDLYKSLNPEKALFNSEWHSFDIRVNPEFVKCSMWQAFFHGLAAGIEWHWPKHKQKTHTNLQKEPETLCAVAEANISIRRNIDYIIPFVRKKREMAFMYSIPTKLFHPADYLSAIKNWYAGIFFSNMPVDFITPDMILGGKSDKYKALLLPELFNAKDEVYEKIKDGVANGLNIIATQNAFSMNEKNALRKADDFLNIIKSGKAVSTYGKGKVYILNTPDNWKKCRDVLTETLKKCSIESGIELKSPDGKDIWGVECRMAERNGKKLMYLINLLKKESKFTIQLENPMKKWKGILDGKNYADSFTLPPGEILILEEI